MMDTSADDTGELVQTWILDHHDWIGRSEGALINLAWCAALILDPQFQPPPEMEEKDSSFRLDEVAYLSGCEGGPMDTFTVYWFGHRDNGLRYICYEAVGAAWTHIGSTSFQVDVYGLPNGRALRLCIPGHHPKSTDWSETLGEVRARGPAKQLAEVQDLVNAAWGTTSAQTKLPTPAVEPLVQVVAEGRQWKSHIALKLLMDIGDPRALRMLLQVMRDPHWPEHWPEGDMYLKLMSKDAIRSLMQAIPSGPEGDPFLSEEELGELLNHRDDRVQNLAKEMLQKRTDSRAN